jgi:hypothetical protein
MTDLVKLQRERERRAQQAAAPQRRLSVLHLDGRVEQRVMSSLARPWGDLSVKLVRGGCVLNNSRPCAAQGVVDGDTLSCVRCALGPPPG